MVKIKLEIKLEPREYRNRKKVNYKV